MNKIEITQEFLKEILDYNSETGIFVYKNRDKSTFNNPSIATRVNNRYAGKATGCIGKDGYVVISINNKLYKAHRLAWMYIYGKWPDDDIDHKDNIKHNNRIINLR